MLALAHRCQCSCGVARAVSRVMLYVSVRCIWNTIFVTTTNVCYREIVHIWDTIHRKWMSSKYSLFIQKRLAYFVPNVLWQLHVRCVYSVVFVNGSHLQLMLTAQTHSVKSLTEYGYWSVESWGIAEAIFHIHIYVTITMSGDEWIRCRVLNTSVACCGSEYSSGE